MPTGKQLTAPITKLDAGLFAAYNDCDLTSFARYIAPDIHFYHDKTGLMVGRSKLVSARSRAESQVTNGCGALPNRRTEYPIARAPVHVQPRRSDSFQTEQRL